MSDKKFQFVNKEIEKDDFLKDDLKDKKTEKQKKSEEELLKKKRKEATKRIVILTTIYSVIAVILFVFLLFWSDDTSLMGITNAIWFSSLLMFAIAWFSFSYNLNAFSALIYGTKVFANMIVGKRPKEDYYTYMLKVKDNNIPKIYFIIPFIISIVLLIPAVILLFIV